MSGRLFFCCRDRSRQVLLERVERVQVKQRDFLLFLLLIVVFFASPTGHGVRWRTRHRWRVTLVRAVAPFTPGAVTSRSCVGGLRSVACGGLRLDEASVGANIVWTTTRGCEGICRAMLRTSCPSGYSKCLQFSNLFSFWASQYDRCGEFHYYANKTCLRTCSRET